MYTLNETELLQANGGILPVVPFVTKKALAWMVVKLVAKPTIKAGGTAASGYYAGKSIESIVENSKATRELNQATDQLHETTDLIRDFNDKRAAA